MSAARRWSLARRTTAWFALTTALLTLAVTLVSAWFLDISLERELDALLDEELTELELRLPARAGPAEFERATRQLSADHPGFRIGWRVWRDEREAPWGEFGDRSVLRADVPARAPAGRMRAADPTLRWKTRRLEDGTLVGAVIDGAPRIELLEQYGGVALALAGGAGVLGLGAGALFARRIARQLRDVARGARRVRSSHELLALDVEGAPEEIREVADALQDMLGNVRGEHERARVLAAGLAHELGAPLQNLIGTAEVALLSPETSDESRELMSSQLEDLRDLARSVDNLVGLTTMRELGATELEEFDLGRELELRLVRERSRAERRRLRLDIRTEGDLRMHGDREGLLLAISNLVSNAIDWSPEGATVSVVAAGDAGAVETTVDDAGPGVPGELREKIFEPFFRGPSRQGRRSGYGLGLAIAKKVVDAHSGRIAIGASPAGGARFRVRIPRGEADDDQVARAHAVAS